MATFLRVLLVRHGQSLNNVLMDKGASVYSKHRVADAPLTELGVAQAVATGEVMALSELHASVPLLQVYTSAMARALGTACEIGSRLSLRPRLFPAIHEVGGIFDIIYGADHHVLGCRGIGGMSASAVRAQYPTVDIPDDGSIDERGWWHHADKEAECVALLRVQAILEELLDAARVLPAIAARSSEAACTLGDVVARTFDVRRRHRHVTASEPAPAPLQIEPSAAIAAANASTSVSDAYDTLDSVADHVRWHQQPAATLAPAVPVSTTGRSGGAVGSSPLATAVHAAGACHSSGGSFAIALVCHGDFIETLLRLVVAHAQGQRQHHHHLPLQPAAAPAGVHTSSSSSSSAPPHLATASFCHHNCAMSSFDIFPDGGVRMVHVNDTSHLKMHPLLRAAGLLHRSAALAQPTLSARGLATAAAPQLHPSEVSACTISAPSAPVESALLWRGLLSGGPIL